MRLIIVTGQTATGKTKLALELAHKYDGELVNCDSRQIYKHLDVITGKDLRLISKNKIWLYDIVKPNQYFSSFDYVNHAIPVLKNILERGKIPILVGGTYLYLYHLLYAVDTEHIPPDWELRKRLASKTVGQLQQYVRQMNASYFDRLNKSDRSNPQRLIRKLEIMTRTRIVPATRFEPKRLDLASKLGISGIRITWLGLLFGKKEILRKIIRKRVEERLKMGAVEEVKKLLTTGYTKNDPGLKTIGYQQIIQYFDGILTKDEAIELWIMREIQYAKRQYTFMKKDQHITWKTI